MFGFIRKIKNLIITHSKPYRELAERLADARRENSFLTKKMDDLRQDSQEDRLDYEARLERANDDVIYAGARYNEARADLLASEARVAELQKSQDNLNEQLLKMKSYAIQGLEGVLEAFGKAPGFLVTADFIPIKANESACMYFGEQVVGTPLDKLGLYQEESLRLKEEIIRNGGPFVINYKGSKLNGWGIVPLMDDGKKILACLFTSEQELVKKITAEKQGFFRNALAAFIGRRQLDDQGMAIGYDFNLIRVRG